jgi:hypothetical protein
LRCPPTGGVQIIASGVELDAEPGIALAHEGHGLREFKWSGDRLIMNDLPEGVWTVVARGRNFIPKEQVEVVKGEVQTIQVEIQRGSLAGFDLEFANDDWETVAVSITDSEGKSLDTRTRTRSTLDITYNRVSVRLPTDWVKIQVSTDNGLTANARLEIMDSPEGVVLHALRLE